uniref:Uncharacterized protein n=1 Tax=Ditylenchus dipsaci TaxID=166011 RepID=A0A915ESV7_9BILA
MDLSKGYSSSEGRGWMSSQKRSATAFEKPGKLDDYLEVDDQLATSGARTLEENVADVSAYVEETGMHSDTEVLKVDDEPEPPVTTQEAAATLRILHNAMSTQMLIQWFNFFATMWMTFWPKNA